MREIEGGTTRPAEHILRTQITYQAGTIAILEDEKAQLKAQRDRLAELPLLILQRDALRYATYTNHDAAVVAEANWERLLDEIVDHAKSALAALNEEGK